MDDYEVLVELLHESARGLDEQLMAITATFEADFNQFVAEAEKANASLGKIEATSKSVGAALDDFKGVAENLAGAFGIAFSVRAAVDFVQALVTTADALAAMSVKTGNSIEQLQRFAFVGAQAHVSMEDLAQASFKLGVALDGGDASVVRAVDRLGLSYNTLRALSPDDQFNATVAALAAMTDAQERNRAGVELFGKAWSTIAPAVAKGYADMAAQATVSSTAQIKAIEEASNAWTRWVQTQKTAITSSLGNIILLRDAVASLPKGYAELLLQTDKSIKSTEELDAALIRAAANRRDVELPSMQEHLSLTKAEQEAADKFAATWAELDAVGVGWRGTLAGINQETIGAVTYYLEAGVAQGKLVEAFKLSTEQVGAIEKLRVENEKYAAALAEVDSAGVDYIDTLTKMGFVTVHSVEDALRAGVAQSALATVYGLTATQVKAVATSIKEKDAAVAQSIAIEAEYVKASAEHEKAIAAASHDTMAAQIADAYTSAQVRIAEMQKTKGYSVAAEMEIWAAADQTAKNIQQSSLESDVRTRAHAELVADQARIAYERALASSNQYTDADLDNMRKTAEAAALAAQQWGTAFEDASAKVSVVIQKTTDAALASFHQIAMASAAATIPAGATNPFPDTIEGRLAQLMAQQAANPGQFINIAGLFAGLPTRASGGPVTAGASYLVGEGGPELFVPASSGSILPNGGGPTVVNHIYVNGTATDVARQVAAEIVRTFSLTTKH